LTEGTGTSTALDALQGLREGNARFVSNAGDGSVINSRSFSKGTSAQQRPLAILLGCSDSRVPAEIVFDQGLGDLFVIRVAGNIVAPSQVDSVEFAAELFGTRLVVVLGHSNCGAVRATLNELLGDGSDPEPRWRSIVDRITPTLTPLLETDLRHDKEELARQSVRANVRASANHLRQGSQILERLIRTEGLLVVGAEYSLETGEVDFFDGVPTGERK